MYFLVLLLKVLDEGMKEDMDVTHIQLLNVPFEEFKNLSALSYALLITFITDMSEI